MRELVARALDDAVAAGADYADVRIVDTEREDISTRNGTLSSLDRGHALGVGVRVLAGGAWGFASSSRLERDEIGRIARLAVAIARASARTRRTPVVLVPEPVHVDRWANPIVTDPFTVPLEEKLGLLLQIDAVLRAKPAITVAEGSMSFQRIRQWLGTSAGTYVDQQLVRSGAGYTATAVGEGDVQTRSYPASFGGQYMALGYELVRGMPLLEHAARVRDEAVQLLTAPPCPEGTRDLILDSSQLALQIHESCGHASELDRALGMEESFAGRSFLTPDKLGSFRYGSPLVNLVADMTIPGGLATRGYDDDGVRTQRFHVVRDGMFVAFTTSREVAGAIGETASRGCSRAEGFNAVPIVRIPNLSLSPGSWAFDDLVADTEDGVYMETNRSWSIDQMRLNFEFGCEAGWEIKGGKRGRLLKNPTYQGITPGFWGSCDAICNDRHFTLWGVPNCGKGEPMQVGEMSHGAAPARFRGVKVGVKA